MGVLLFLSRAIDRLNHFLGRSVLWVVLLMVLISALNALARKLFHVGSNAMLEIQWYLFAAVFMLASGYVLLNNAHVRIDVLASRLSARTRTWIDIVGFTVFVLPLCWLVIDLSWPVVSRAYVSGEMSGNAGGLIRWPVYMLLPIGFGLVALQSISEIIKRIGFLCGRCPNPFAPPASEEHMNDAAATPRSGASS